MGGEDHVAGAVEDDVAGVGSKVVEKLDKVGIGEFGGCDLGGAKFAEVDEELAVDCATFIYEGADNGLDAFEAGVVNFGAGVGRVGKLLLGAIVDWSVAKSSMLGFGWKGLAPFEEKVLDVVIDGKTAGAFGVVPVEVNAGETGFGPVLGIDGIYPFSVTTE